MQAGCGGVRWGGEWSSVGWNGSAGVVRTGQVGNCMVCHGEAGIGRRGEDRRGMSRRGTAVQARSGRA